MLAVAFAVALIAVSLAFEDELGRAIHAGFARVSVTRALEGVLALAVAGTLVVFVRDHAWARGLFAWIVGVLRAASARISRVPAGVALPVIVAVVAAVWISLDAAATLPRVFGDELIYSDLAKSFARHGRLLLRGEPDLGHSILYPIAMSPAYALAHDGAAAFAAIKVVNAVVMSLTAVPAYYLARRVVSHSWSLIVAMLSVAVPAMGYTALVMTEPLFYPAFVCFALALTVMLEGPTRRSQLTVVGMAFALVTVRPQALALVPAVLTAVLIDGARTRSIRSALARFGTAWVAFALLGSVWLVASQFTSSAPAGAYGVLLHAYNPLALVKWAAWNLADLELALGVVAFGAFPLALVGMLRRQATAGEGAVGAVAVSLFAWTLASVVVLSASTFGLDRLHERNLFYVAPLLLTCFVWWLVAGLPRPVGLATATSATCLVLAAALPGRLVTYGRFPDSLVAQPLARLSALAPSIPITRVLVVFAALGVIALLRSHRAAIPLLSVALALGVQTATNDWTASLPRSHEDAPAWIDNALPASAHVTLLYVDLPPNACPAREPNLLQPKLATWTEFFNVSVDRVVSLFAPNRDSGLGSPTVTFNVGGTLLRRGQPLSPRYVAVDARVPLVGTPLATIDASALGLKEPDRPLGALTLWRAEQPLRLADPGALQNPRRQTLSCRPTQ